ncbi:hypothetical protein GCM10023350_06420 [Nocardioides endophyticus]|uniref:Uncharacterized protein n=1 Tax=Nocardioides endophyticus TaxID=1353775 RepID=A0ABP8YC55_9ACTN
MQRHRPLLRKRRFALEGECSPPSGQAGYWCANAVRDVPLSGQYVAKQLARLCGDDSKVAMPWRSLADAVGVTDRAGRHVAYTQRGVLALVEAGWLRVETVGAGRGAVTTFYLMPGDRFDLLWRRPATADLAA